MVAGNKYPIVVRCLYTLRHSATGRPAVARSWPFPFPLPFFTAAGGAVLQSVPPPPPPQPLVGSTALSKQPDVEGLMPGLTVLDSRRQQVGKTSAGGIFRLEVAGRSTFVCLLTTPVISDYLFFLFVASPW